jgi:hypothetical protein
MSQPAPGPRSRRLRRAAAGAGLVLALAAPPALAARATIDQPIIVLQGLDKITARVSRFEVPVGQTIEFGTLDITIRACRTTAPEETPENAAFLQITDEPPGEARRTVFSGWMFSSSPAVSALDHAVYDVWVVRCAESVGLVDEFEIIEPPPPLPEQPPLPPALPTFRQI